MNVHEPRSNQGLEAQWMPFSANRDFKAAPRLIRRSAGVPLWNQDGVPLIDGSSGLFNVAAGHGRKEIAATLASSEFGFPAGPPSAYR